MPSYTWLTFAQAKTALAQRLADVGKVFFTDAELGIYLVEALRVWNALTATTNSNFTFSTAGLAWVDLTTQSLSPRLRTVTDTELYTLIQYHLMEPPSGGTWTGTPQFTISDVSGALQRRRDEIIESTACSVAIQPLVYSVGNPRAFFPDSTLEARRVRFLPSGATLPITLSREDALGFEYFSPTSNPITVPQAFTVITGPPLAMDVDYPATMAGSYESIIVQAGRALAPPASTVLGLPDDWTWVAKYGAMGDLLSKDIEAADPLRAAYCLKRYQEGVKIMRECPWLTLASVDGVPVDTPGVGEMDSYSSEWDSRTSGETCVVVGGVDFVRLSPFGSGSHSVSLTLIGSVPVPANGDFMQCSRDTFDALLDYSEHIGSFKRGGEEFMATKPLYDNFIRAAVETNRRLELLGIFRDVLKREGHRQEEAEQRYKI